MVRAKTHSVTGSWSPLSSKWGFTNLDTAPHLYVNRGTDPHLLHTVSRPPCVGLSPALGRCDNSHICGPPPTKKQLPRPRGTIEPGIKGPGNPM